jgi:hypothetical protein
MSQEKINKLIEAGKASAVTTAAELSDDGYHRIRELLREFMYNEWQGSTRLYSVDYDEIFDGKLLVNGSGKIAKRIRRNLRRIHDLALPNELISQIGNMAANYTLPADNYTIEFTDDCLGTVGKFGDYSCCFQPGEAYHEHCQALHIDPNCGAVRIYNGNGEGIARSWTFADPNDGAICLFNSYGLRLNKIGELVELTGNYGSARYGSISGEIYLNSNGETIIFGGSQDHYYLTADPDQFDLENCADCSDQINPDHDDYHYISGRYYCAGCAGYCQHCQEHYPNDDTYFYPAIRPRRFNNGIETITICDNCQDQYFSECENCGDYWPTATLNSADNDTVLICENCADLITDCIDCAAVITVENCADQSAPRCADCQDDFNSREGCADCQNSPFQHCADCYSQALFNRRNLAQLAGNQRQPLIDLIAEKQRQMAAVENCRKLATETATAEAFFESAQLAELAALRAILAELT